MKFLIVAALIASACAASTSDSDATVLRSDANVDEQGYKYGYETSNKIVAEEKGVLKNPGTDNEALQVTGEFSYVSAEGTPVKVTYTADENGFHPDSSVLPVAPPVPEAIARAIKLLPIVETKRK